MRTATYSYGYTIGVLVLLVLLVLLLLLFILLLPQVKVDGNELHIREIDSRSNRVHAVSGRTSVSRNP